MANSKKHQNKDKYEVVTVKITKADLYTLVRTLEFRIEFDDETSDKYKEYLSELSSFLSDCIHDKN